MAELIVLLGPVVLGFVLWKLLDRHEARRAAAGLPRHSRGRLAVVAGGAMLALLSAGFGAILMVVVGNWPGARNPQDTAQAVTIFAVPPFVLGAAVCGLAMRRKRANQPAP